MTLKCCWKWIVYWVRSTLLCLALHPELSANNVCQIVKSHNGHHEYNASTITVDIHLILQTSPFKRLTLHPLTVQGLSFSNKKTSSSSSSFDLNCAYESLYPLSELSRQVPWRELYSSLHDIVSFMMTFCGYSLFLANLYKMFVAQM